MGQIPNQTNFYPEELGTGGYFITKNNIKKIVVFKEDLTCTWPKYDLERMNCHHISLGAYP